MQYLAVAHLMGRPDGRLSVVLVPAVLWAPVLAVAVTGTAARLGLLAGPMAEMATGCINGYRIGDLATLAVIAVEISTGMMLLELQRATSPLPAIGGFFRFGSICMAITTGALLLALAGIERGIAFERDLLIQDDAATRAALEIDKAEIVKMLLASLSDARNAIDQAAVRAAGACALHVATRQA
jgi:hypothetical protein